jgi:uncharacterized protein (DUF1800 family)
VDGGYTQQDVQELARILTGWTIEGLGPAAARRLRRDAADGSLITFAFHDVLHDPGTKTVLGRQYEESGRGEGERVIRDLCRHRHAATFVAAKLVRHFVADDPPAAAVERVARAFRSTDGDLKAVAQALVDEPEAWREGTQKFRTPQEWLVAVLRAVDVEDVAPSAAAALRQLRQPVWSPPSPQGYSDAMQDWADPDSLLNRAELARTIAGHLAPRRVDPRGLLDVVDVAAGDPLHRMLADSSIPAGERLALGLAAPAFQWR